MSVKYFIYKRSTRERVQVCQKVFLDTLRLSRTRVIGVVSRFFKTSQMPRETRGGDRKLTLYQAKKQSIVSFIKKFKVIEGHYCRSKTNCRVYLSSGLNIRKMWRLYNENEADEALKVKESYFRYVFTRNFNIGFGTPGTDECSTCLSLTEKIKYAQNDTQKHSFMAEKRVHKLKAKAFYTLLKEERDDLLTMSFDCQKNQVLPRVQDQSAYYSRQIYKYNLTCVVGHSKAKLTKDNVFAYHWQENEHNKSPNEICSAVYDCLCRLDIPENIKVLRLASDGCGGQNKNNFMMGMLGKWLLTKCPKNVKYIEYIFPIVGHSFLPSDRVFGMIEKEIKKHSTIITPEEYTNIFSKFATTVSLTDKNYNWKDSVAHVLRPPGQWHLKFNPTKRFYLKRTKKGHDVKVRGEVHYRADFGTYQRICKAGKKFKHIQFPAQITPGVPLAEAKVRDVSKLLSKHFGDDWRSLEILSFYRNVEQNNNRPMEQNAADEENIVNCDHDCQDSDLVV